MLAHANSRSVLAFTSATINAPTNIYIAIRVRSAYLLCVELTYKKTSKDYIY